MKSMLYRLREFLILADSEKYNAVPDLQIKAKVLRWDLEKIFKFPTNASQSGVENDRLSNGSCICESDPYRVCPIHKIAGGSKPPAI